MLIPHLPILEIIKYIRTNQVFIRISRVFFLILVALSAIGCTGEWIKGFDYNSLPCTMGKWECYQGQSLSMMGYVYDMGVPRLLFLVPIIDIFAAFILLLKPSRTYFLLLLLSAASIVIGLTSEPDPYLYIRTGRGQGLHQFSIILICFLALPLAINEQLIINPKWNEYVQHI